MFWMRNEENSFPICTLIWRSGQKPPLDACAEKPARLEVYCLVFAFFYFCILCIQEAKALARVYIYTGLTEPSLHANVISTKLLCAGRNI